MSRDIIAVEVQGWDRNYWNLLPDSRDLSTWTLGTDNTAVAYTATGISGLPNTASVITDQAVSPSAFAYVDSPTLHIQDEDYLSARIWVLKDAVSSPDPGLRIYIEGSVAIGYGFDTSTGTLTFDPASTASIYGSSSALRTINGQDWYEVWIWCYAGGAGEQRAFVRVYPALFTGATATRSVTIGNVELYNRGTKEETSPLAFAFADINGTPPNYGDVFLASEYFITKEAGTTLHSLFPALYPWPPRYGPTDTIFEGRLSSAISYSVSVSPFMWGRRGAVGLGSIEVINDDGSLDAWREWEWRDRHVTIKLHNSANDYLETQAEGSAGAQTLLKAIVERMEVVDERRMRLLIRDPVPALYLPLNSTYPAASASPDPYIDAHYRVTPITFGDPKQCEPVLVDSAAFKWELHDGALNAVTEVYVNGVPQSTASPTYTASGAGFTLPGEASGRVTADPQSTATADLDALCTSLTSRVTVTFDAVTRAQYSALSYGSPEVTYKYAYYIHDTTTPADILDMAVSSFGGWWYVNRFGNVVFGQLKTPGTVLENLLINSPYDPRDLTTWQQTNGVATSYYQTGVDGERTATFVSDNSALQERIEADVLTNAGTDPVTVRVWVEKDSTVSHDAAVLMRWNGSTVGNFTINRSNGNVTDSSGGSNSSVQATERSLGGGTWYEWVMQVDNSGYDILDLRFYPAGISGGAATDSCVIGGIEVYDNANITDVNATPPNLTTSRLLTDQDIIADIRVSPDHAPNLSDGMGANKNWSRGRTSEGSGINAEKFSREYQDEYRSTTSMSSSYDHAINADLPDSLLTDATAAQTEADRITMLYQRERFFYRVPVALDHVQFDDVIDSIGQTYSLTSDRFNLSSLPLVLVGVDGRFLDNEVELTFWG